MLCKLILCTIILLPACILHAQDYDDNKLAPTASHNATPVWKKRVSRLINTQDSLDENGNLHKKEFGDTTLTKLLLNAVIKGEIIPYDVWDATFSTRCSEKYINDVLHEKADTTTTVIDNSVIAVIESNEFASKFYVLEERIFDPIQRETEIDIIGIGLVKDKYGNYGSAYPKNMFWMKWEDVKNIVNDFMNTHPKNNIQNYLWDERYKCQTLYTDKHYILKSSKEKVWSKLILRDIEIRDTTNCPDHIYTENPCWSLGEAFYDSIHKNYIPAYNDSEIEFKNTMPFNSIGIRTVPDTMLNTETGETLLAYHELDWNWIYNYSILERWDFYPNQGITKIKLLGIKPRLDLTKFIKYNNLFWVCYDDVLDILQRYDEYHPLNNLSTALWQSYFQPQTAK